MITVLNGSQPRPSSEAVFFPFDPFNVPLLGGLKLHLVSGAQKGIVVGRGTASAVDHYQLNYYGSTDERFHLVRVTRFVLRGRLQRNRGGLDRGEHHITPCC